MFEGKRHRILSFFSSACKTIVFGNQLARLAKFLLPQLGTIENCEQPFTILTLSPLQGQNQRQGHLSFGKIVADRLAGLARLTLIIQKIVDHLECAAQLGAIGPQSPPLMLLPSGTENAYLTGRSDEQSCFAHDGIMIIGLREIMQTRVAQLHEFTINHPGRSIGKERKGLSAANLPYDGHRSGMQKISGQYRGHKPVIALLTDGLPRRVTGVIDDVVVKEGGGMQILERPWLTW